MFFGKSEEEILREAYYGKSKQLKIIEAELEKMLKEYNQIIEYKDGATKIKKNPKALSDLDSIRIIERQFCKMFNLRKFCLAMYTALPLGVFNRISFNAYTWGKGFNSFKKHKESWKRIDSTDMTIGVNVDIGLIKHAKLEADELLAIILHEIGHNMSASPFNILSQISLNPISTFIGPIYKEVLGYPMTKLNQGIEIVLDKMGPVKTFLNAISSFTLNLITLIPKITVLLIHPLVLLSNIGFRTIFGYSEEKYADSFATAYGYGTALARALEKFELKEGIATQRVINKIPVLNIGYDLLNVSSGIILGIVNEHPQTPNRIQAQLKKLRRDAQDPNIDPRQREIVEADIKELEDFINNEYLDISKDMTKGKIFTALYKRVCINLFNGNGDIREIFQALHVEE